jgi:hypothetical protein
VEQRRHRCAPTVLKLPSPTESSQAARYRGRWVPRSRSGLSARRTLDPSGISDTTRGQGRDSLDDPLLGLGSPSRLSRRPPPSVSRPRAPLLGFSAPSAHQVGRVHVQLALAPPGCPVGRRRVPPLRLRCRSQVFPTSQRLAPLPALPPFSDGWRSWGSALQGILPLTKLRRLVAAGIPSWPCSRGLRMPPS